MVLKLCEKEAVWAYNVVESRYVQVVLSCLVMSCHVLSTNPLAISYSNDFQGSLEVRFSPSNGHGY